MECKRCGGDGQKQNILGDMKACLACDGVGSFPEIDELDIMKRLFVKRGDATVLRKSRPTGKRISVAERRAYYVWRLAKFHGGKDITMPMTATLLCDGDPCIDKLDIMANRVAEQAFGSNMAGAYRWAGALGVLPRLPEVPK